MADLILPSWVHQIQEASYADAKDPKCPAASLGHYADSGKQYLRCGVERRHFPVQESPLAVHGWCCDDYASCPVWIAGKEDDPALARTHNAQDELDRRAQTERQIETGMRVDDSEERQFEEDYVGDDE